jgi:hypothetical protein
MSVDPPSGRQRDLAVARIRDRPADDFAEVMFLESARIFRLSRSHERFDELLATLRDAEAGERRVRITLTVAHGGDISDVQKL